MQPAATDLHSATDRRHPLVYVLHSSEMYGTERMSLATADGLSEEFRTIFIGPPGEAMEEARRLGFEAFEFRTSKDLARAIHPILRDNPSLTFVATGPRYSLICIAMNALLYRRRIKQIQIVHGGAGEWADYGRKKLLNPFDITFIAVSDYVKQKLIDYGVRPEGIEVAYNFLTSRQIEQAPKRPALTSGIRNVAIASRVVDYKCVDLILDAMDRHPELSDLPIRVMGDGPDLEKLRQRARTNNPNVAFVGFDPDVAGEFAKADLLLHLCPTEPFGLVILEAMAANLPVLVPDAGGAGGIVEDGINGFKFRAGDPDDLARRLISLRKACPQMLNRITAGGRDSLATRFSAEASGKTYRRLFSAVE
jgi:glycosyltransferase involved in cell wall biosynthesis